MKHISGVVAISGVANNCKDLLKLEGTRDLALLAS